MSVNRIEPSDGNSKSLIDVMTRFAKLIWKVLWRIGLNSFSELVSLQPKHRKHLESLKLLDEFRIASELKEFILLKDIQKDLMGDNIMDVLSAIEILGKKKYLKGGYIFKNKSGEFIPDSFSSDLKNPPERVADIDDGKTSLNARELEVQLAYKVLNINPR